MAPDQRYCLNCGNRRGDPRLPFMDAVVFMEATKVPPGPTPPPGAPAAGPAAPNPDRKGISANATLVAGVATLVLAIGVGVLIGRSGDDGSTNAANATPQVITVAAEGDGGEGNGGDGGGGTGGGGGGSANKSGNEGKKDQAKEGNGEDEAGESGASEAAEEVLQPEDGVKLPPPKAQVGEDCEKDTAGCSESGEFDGSFFGE